MRSGNAGQEIAEGVLFHEIDDGDLAAERVGIFFPEIVGAERDVEEVSRGNAVRSAGLLPRANKLRKNSGKCIAQTGADYVFCFVGAGDANSDLIQRTWNAIPWWDASQRVCS